MRTFLKILIILWIAVWLFVGISMFIETPEQIKKDKAFKEKDIKPCVDFVKNFKNSNNRLPTYKEYYTWEREYFNDYNSDLTQTVDSLIPGFGCNSYIRSTTSIVSDDLYKFKKANWTKDFAIGIWRGSWTEYYFSWNDSYDPDNYSWFDGIFELVIITALAFLPLMFWWYKRIKKP